MAVEYIDRPPRIQPELPIAEIDIPQPPDEKKRSEQGVITMLIPLVTILGFVLVSGSGSALLIIPMGLAMVLSVGVALVTARRERKELAEYPAEEAQEALAPERVERVGAEDPGEASERVDEEPGIVRKIVALHPAVQPVRCGPEDGLQALRLDLRIRRGDTAHGDPRGAQ